MSEKEIDLSMFCHKVHSRYDLHKPFVRNGWLTATDGRICVRIKTNLPDTKDINVPDINASFALCTSILSKPIGIVLPGTGVGACDDCEGNGTGGRICDICGGGGRHECDCGVEHKCGECEGEGRIEKPDTVCWLCEGEGRGFADVEIAGCKFAGKYTNMIARKFPTAKAVMMQAPDEYNATILYFRFEGGEGVLTSLKD